MGARSTARPSALPPGPGREAELGLRSDFIPQSCSDAPLSSSVYCVSCQLAEGLPLPSSTLLNKVQAAKREHQKELAILFFFFLSL